MKKERIMTDQITPNEFKGFSLFNDVEDTELRNRNRAVILTNIATSHTKNRKITPGGAGLIIRYFNLIPPHERQDVQSKFVDHMKREGMHLVGA